MWEEIKAAESGSTAASSSWDEWAQNVVNKAREDANIGDYDLQAIYILEVTEDEIAKEIMKIEQYQDQQSDIVLMMRKP